MEAQKRAPAMAAILAAAALWGVIGLWNRKLMAAGLSPYSIVVVRNLGGMALLVLFFAVKDRSVFRVERRCLKYFFGTGVVSVLLFTVCYFSCQKLCSLAAASILLYTAPSFVVLLSAALWKEPVSGKKLLALLLTLLGCACVCGVFDRGLSVTLPGILLGLGSGFFYALYSIFGRYALAHCPPLTVTVWTFLFAGPASLVLFRPAELGAAFGGNPSLLGTALVLAAFSTAAPYILYTWGLARIEPGRASILASLEPVVAALTGILAFGEPMSPATVLGMLCVLAGVTILR
ncbi:MAG: EamA family transporter [Oscillibacter sp.]|jgi:DME family drug/metabolite transporter|nr:EamA family transporter [uncultured Oscillibacter sp.]MCI8970526.1 EamA family transporter [Oscillibacter sp.]MCI9578596.1 EamA family transporter [Oscillibacter sp.]